MTEEFVLYYGQQALITSLAVAGPLLITALVVGTLVSVLQAVTQVQEITLVFVPKILAVFAVIGLAGGWMLQVTVAFATQMFLSIPATGP
jgi:flagellar biosynthesis protein FliQ